MTDNEIAAFCTAFYIHTLVELLNDGYDLREAIEILSDERMGLNLLGLIAEVKRKICN